jgi:hypothetical protein
LHSGGGTTPPRLDLICVIAAWRDVFPSFTSFAIPKQALDATLALDFDSADLPERVAMLERAEQHPSIGFPAAVFCVAVLGSGVVGAAAVAFAVGAAAVVVAAAEGSAATGAADVVFSGTGMD